MLKKEENRTLTLVGPNTAMGQFFRQYWHPILLTNELPHADCPQLRVRVLGEDLIAFRDTSGRVGFLGEQCPHRKASLFYGRSEEGGLRCAYHGWKFDIHGQCLEVPNEPNKSAARKICHKAYPALERGGAIWIYMGAERVPPPLPGLEWIELGSEQRYQSKRVQNCNWLQALEGDIDQSHVGFTHRRLSAGDTFTGRPEVDRIRLADTHPRFKVQDMPYGVMICAERSADEQTLYLRVTQYLFPHWTMTGPYGDNPTRHNRAWIPIDDQTTLLFSITFHPLIPLPERTVSQLLHGHGAGYVGEANFLPPTNEAFGAWKPKASRSNDFLFDRALQKTKHYSGIPDFWAQDAALQESMGTIADRTDERLVTGDIGILRVRRRLLDVVKSIHNKGAKTPVIHDPAAYRVRAASMLVPAGTSWIDATADHRRVIAGENQPGV